MADTVGKLIKEARTKAGLTQEQLAKKMGGGMTAAQISRAERGAEALTQEQLKVSRQDNRRHAGVAAVCSAGEQARKEADGQECR